MKKRNTSALTLVSKGLCALLCLYCAVQARAGLAYYQGLNALEQKHLERALGAFASAEEQGFGSAGLEFAFAEASYEAGLAGKDAKRLQEAQERFEKLGERLPGQGRPLVYRAFALLAQKENSAALRAGEWNEIKSLFKEALKRQPGSLWIQFNVSTTELSYDRFLSAQEKSEALERLQKVSRILPERYLEPSLSFLWQRYKKTELLRRVTPLTHETYKILLDYLFAARQWKAWHDAYGIYREMRTTAYQALCQKGEALLAAGQYEQAEAAFQEALWLDPAAPWARTGRVISHYGHKMALPDEEGTRSFLKKVLEDDPAIGKLLPHLGPVLREMEDAYLKGLYLLKTNRPGEAVSELKGVREEKLSRYHLARAYKEMGDLKAAYALFPPADGTKSLNSREALLLKEINPAVNESDQASPAPEVKEVQRKPRRGWWSEAVQNGPLYAKGRTGMKISLLPGKARLFIPARLQEEGDSGAVLMVRLGEQVLGTLFAGKSVWTTSFFDVETQGGDFWLSAELLHDAPEGVTLGDVLIKTKPKEGISDGV